MPSGGPAPARPAREQAVAVARGQPVAPLGEAVAALGQSVAALREAVAPLREGIAAYGIAALRE
jgi:hypothetical protein